MEEWQDEAVAAVRGDLKAGLIDSVTLSALPVFIWHSWA
jgi:hypothetical protein